MCLIFASVNNHFVNHTLQKNEVLIVWPGATHALTEVKLNPQVYYMQQYSPAKFHPDWSTFMRMAPKKLVFGL